MGWLTRDKQRQIILLIILTSDMGPGNQIRRPHGMVIKGMRHKGIDRLP